MDLVHWSAGHHYRDDSKWRRLCDREWVVHPDYDPAKHNGSWGFQQRQVRKLFSNAAREITCHKCLELLVLKKRTELAQLESQFKAARDLEEAKSK